MDNAIIRAILAIGRRADSVDPETLQASFVGIGNIDLRLSSPDHQIVYGRRGTGKTHTFKYLLANTPERTVPIYIDVRGIGSNGSIYGDQSLTLQKRATTLLVDFLGALHDQMLEFFVSDQNSDLSVAGPLLDRLANAISATRVEGPVAVTQQASITATEKDSLVGKMALKPELGASSEQGREAKAQTELKYSVVRDAHVVFGDLNGPLRGLGQQLGGRRFVLLVDEWSDVPLDLQPFLSDLIRKALIASGITLKIAAIEHRSNFAMFTSGGQYIGLQLGADIMADINIELR